VQVVCMSATAAAAAAVASRDNGSDAGVMLK